MKRVQSAEHVAPGGSQTSVPWTIPSPQAIVLVQILGCPEQALRGSTWQVAEQPSPLTRLLSSQVSLPRMSPSPQIGLVPEEVTTQPSSRLHRDEHPSPLLGLPSSHSSSGVRVPSPQTSLIHVVPVGQK
jgi:hypothetical protein